MVTNPQLLGVICIDGGDLSEWRIVYCSDWLAVPKLIAEVFFHVTMSEIF
jgi:hypothetical protein